MASSSLKFPYPSGVNVGDFVTVKLSPMNYYIWRSMILDLLKIHGLNGFIDGSIPPPPEKIGEAENPDFLEWKKSDGLVRRWILSTLSESVLIYVHRLPTAKEMWVTIEKGSTQPFLHEIEIDHKGLTEANLSKYIPLSTAALNNDWEKAKEFLEKEPNAVRAFITGVSETALMIAARSSDRLNFVRELLVKMDPPDLALPNFHGLNALHMAAGSSNTEAAKLIVEKNPLLPNIFDKSLSLPLHVAALFGKREMVLYLLSVTKEDVEPKLFEGESGVKLVHGLVASGLYGIQITCAIIVGRHRLGTCFDNTLMCQHCIHQPVQDILQFPQIRSIQDLKTTNYHAVELVKCLCSEIVKLDHSKASVILGVPVKTASCIGVHEIIEEILGSFPSAIYLTDEMNRTLFHLAIVNRRENIFNIIYQVEHKHVFLRAQDRLMNNCLHLAGSLDLESQQKLNLRNSAAGAALQVQRELQWFKAVEEFILKQDKEQRNSKGQTPAMVFTESHQDLVKEGEQWMKDTSNSCTIVAALIVTIVFAAAITVPGGNNGDTGFPMFMSSAAFIVFALSDALALFASTSSVLMFLSILTSRYGEADFLYALPKRLIIGLATLFLSIIFMMVAFGATLQIVIGNRGSWIIIPVVALGEKKFNHKEVVRNYQQVSSGRRVVSQLSYAEIVKNCELNREDLTRGKQVADTMNVRGVIEWKRVVVCIRESV
ncbi:hypothetical protein LguiA_002101 [Lonicera macranthoides]